MKAERSSTAYELYVGIDIAAETASAALLSVNGTAGAAFTIEQTSTGVTQLKRALLATGVRMDGLRPAFDPLINMPSDVEEALSECLI